MNILFIADGRSPIALAWLSYWAKQGHDVSLISTYPCRAEAPLTRIEVVPVVFSQAKSLPPAADATPQKRALLWGSATIKMRVAIRHWLGPLTLPRAADRVNELIDEIKPDLVHAMRIPYEGMLAATAKARNPQHFPPLLMSVWGNDFTLHAVSSPPMRHCTRIAMRTADALHADCHRDIRLAEKWGFDPKRPRVVLPSAAGIDSRIFHPPAEPVEKPCIINPRGFRGYVRNDTFFKAIPFVLEKYPQAKFFCPSMKGVSEVEGWIRKLGIDQQVELTGILTHEELAAAFRRSMIVVSPSIHDGTPNSLLEAMACGCFPIAGELESIGEWIKTEVNGLLIDPSSPRDLAAAILRALDDDALRLQAAKENAAILAECAERDQCMTQARTFYNRLIQP